MEKQIPQDGQVRVNVALQVAGIAAQTTAALQSGQTERCAELERKLARVQSQLDPLNSPPGLVAFIDVVRGLLRGQNVSARAGGLPPSYRAVYEQMVDSISHTNQPDDGELTLRQVLDEVTHDVIVTMQYGTWTQRQEMAGVLFKMRQESANRLYLLDLTDFLEAAQALLEGQDPANAAARLRGTFRDKWAQILDTTEASGT